MFKTTCIPMLISKATLKREMDEEESYRVADISILVEPFHHALAEELGGHVSGHLFYDDVMRPEVSDITIGLRVSDQKIVVQSAPDAPALATLTDVRIGDLSIVRKTKGDREWYRATVSARIDLRERAIREFLFHHFGELRAFTFMDQQPAMTFVGDLDAGTSTSATAH